LFQIKSETISQIILISSAVFVHIRGRRSCTYAAFCGWKQNLCPSPSNG